MAIFARVVGKRYIVKQIFRAWAAARVNHAMKNVLSIAGTDPTGGAGLQADVKSISALGGYAMGVVTALVAQNTQGVRAIHTPPTEFLRQQLDIVSDDVRIDGLKIGMLGNRAVINEVGDWLHHNRPPVVVLDPVMVATSGDRLLDADALTALVELLDDVDVVTPNLPELALLLECAEAGTWPVALAQGQQLAARHGIGVVVKGGHLPGGQCPDALVLPDTAPIEAPARRIRTRNTHGTGCSLSSGLATLRTQSPDWPTAFKRTKDWLQDAIAHADELEVGRGHGPIHHFHALYARAGIGEH